MTDAPERYSAQQVCEQVYWGKWRGPDYLVDAARIAALEADLARARERVEALEDGITRVLSPAPGVRHVEPWAVGILTAAIKPAA